jgi:putative Ca2+/H+ antiporter (TMEM165/GDT1 family)
MDWLTSFLLIFAAEFGDKSQLVCMALAVRYRAAPVALGAIAAFLLLNTLAVLFGAAIANWIPELVIAIIVSLMFLFFGVQSLREANSTDSEEELDESDVAIKSQNHIFFSTLALITLAEFGDKTQLAVVALSARFEPLSVWLGASLALAATSLMAVWAGRTILQRISISLLHRLSGAFFILLGLFAAYSAYLAY